MLSGRKIQEELIQRERSRGIKNYCNEPIMDKFIVMKKIVCILLILIAQPSLFAQVRDIPLEKEFFEGRKDEFKEAKKNFEEGEKIFKIGNYEKARPYFDKVYAFNPNYSKLNYYLGYCVLSSNDKFKAIDFFKKAYELNSGVAPEISLCIGTGYHINGDWDNALKFYEFYRKMLDPKNIGAIESVKKKIAECNTGKELMATPQRVWVDNLGATINSPFPEYAPLISADESIVIFTSRRSDSWGGKKDPGDEKYFEDIYIGKRNEKTGEWDQAQNIGPLINTEDHDAPSGLSPDGKTLFIFYGWKGGGDIYQSDLMNDTYTKPVKLSDNIDSKAYESSASISYDKKELYFISERQDGLGEKDIYVSYWDVAKNEWGPAKNLGSTINTKYPEASVFLHPDGKTLYFSSKGHNTMGGFDIFVSKRGEDGQWGKPQNLGYPINSPDDDVFFVINASGRYGYYSSYRSDGLGEKDIYRITFLGPEKQPLTSSENNLLASVFAPIKNITIEPKVEVYTPDVTILKGIVRDAKTQQPVSAKIELIDNEEDAIIAIMQSDAKTGAYLVSLPSGKNYGIAIEAENYLFYSENVDLSKMLGIKGYKEYEKNIDLKKVEIGQIVVLRNIFYDTGKATLRDASKNELERLIKLLHENATMRIEISGHTDQRGDTNANQKLSEARAKSVVNYLAKAGIASNRLEFKGYGESQPQVLETDIKKMKTKTDKENAYQQNRRTEFKILAL